MTTIRMHPSELAYALSYARTDAVIGWGSAQFLPEGPDDGDPTTWIGRGEALLIAEGRLTGTPDQGLNFTAGMTRIILTLVDPGLVLMAQRKSGGGVRVQTVHVAGDDFIGMTRLADGRFELTRYADLTAAAGACAGFAGAALSPPDRETRIETDHETMSGLSDLARAGDDGRLVAALTGLGAGGAEARSAALALRAPAAKGALSLLWCRGGVIHDAESFSVLTTADDRTWLIFAPGGETGPQIMERGSAAALAARVAVGIAARLVPAG
jgi:hypothetical protein